MKHALPLALVAALALAGPVRAQEAPPKDEGFSLMEEGAKLLFRGLMEEMEPAIGEMGKALKDLEPMLRDLAALVGDVRHYEAPERMPNGDILIRRKAGAPPVPPLPDPPAPKVPQGDEPQIEL